MNNLSVIKAKITKLYNENPKIHIDVSVFRKKKGMTNIPALITAVSPNLFTAVLTEDGAEKSYTFQYVDLLTNNLVIHELELNKTE